MGHIAGWITLGLAAGSLARLLVPGQSRGGWFVTMLLGIIGAFVGGWVALKVGFLPPADPGNWIPGLRSILSATVGASLVLAAWKWLQP